MSRRRRSKIAAFLNEGHTRIETAEFFAVPLATVKAIEADAARGAR